MSFQNYIRTLSNHIDENTACKRYRDFMADLSQSKVGRFFDANKDREWFRLKYHPTENQKIFQQNNSNFLKRLKIFNDLDSQKLLDQISFSISDASRVINLMDAIIVSLESGPQELIDKLIAGNESDIDQNLRHQYVPSQPNSVVLDDVSVETSLAEIQNLCLQADPSLVRLAPQDPYYVAGGQLKRKIVAIYKHDVDIKNVCWTLSRLKLNNRTLSVSINKCLTNRIKTINSIANHHICILNDIRNAVNLILNFDELKGLYGKRKQTLENSLQQNRDFNNVAVKMEVDHTAPRDESLENVAPLSPPGSEKSANEDDDSKPFDVSSLDEEREKERKKMFEFKFNIDMSLYRQASKLSKNKNHILDGAYIYLLDFIESSAAVYQMSKVNIDMAETPNLEAILGDKYTMLDLAVQNLPHSLEQSTRFLDKLLWYLRIVHSFDYYKKQIYRHEDELTMRMSVVHLRGDSSDMETNPTVAIKEYLEEDERDFNSFGSSQLQKYVTKDEERFYYKSYGKVITDELTSYAQKIQKSKTNESEDVYKCKHCTRVFQKLTDIGRHFVSKHRWAIDAIELETDFFNAYLFDPNKINPCPPRELLEVPPNRFAGLTNASLMGEDPDLLKQTLEVYNSMDSFVREPAPRAQVESDPRNESIVDYTDISFDDAI